MRRLHLRLLPTLPCLVVVGLALGCPSRTAAQAKLGIRQGGAIGETTVIDVDAEIVYSACPFSVWISLDYLAWPPTMPLFAGVLDDQGRASHRVHLPTLPSLMGTRIELGFTTWYAPNPPIPLHGRLRWVLGAPRAKRFRRAGDMPAWFMQRIGCAWCVLSDGTLLQTGGGHPTQKVKLPQPCPKGHVPPSMYPFGPPLFSRASGYGVDRDQFNEAFLFDCRTGLARPIGMMHRPRSGHTIVPLPDGTALVLGGDQRSSIPVPSPPPVPTAELFQPNTGLFRFLGPLPFWPTCGPGAIAAVTHPWTGDHYVLFPGVWDVATQKPASYLYDVRNRTFSALGGMIRYRTEPTAVALPGGAVFIAGGYDGPANNKVGVADAEIFEIRTRQFYPAGKMTKPRFGHALAALGPTQVLISGGQAHSSAPAHDDLEVFDGTTFLYRPVPFRLKTRRRGHRLVRRSADTFWVAGGEEYVRSWFYPTITVESVSPRGMTPVPPIPAEQPYGLHVHALGSGRFVAFNDFEYFLF